MLARFLPSDAEAKEKLAHCRNYGGVHFPFDIDAGQSVGKSVGNFVFLNYLTPRR